MAAAAVSTDGVRDIIPPGSYPPAPDGWFKYTNFGRPINGTRIIAIKTPLKKNFHNGLIKEKCPPVQADVKYTWGVSLEDEFTPAQCIERIAATCEGFKLGAVVDLTFTDRYYNRRDFIEAGVKYHKIKVPGHTVPSNSIYAEFEHVVSGMLEEIGSKKLLAVHCTHGLNRTGYLVCRYLIQQRKYNAETAIREFNEARGHHIERPNYIQRLQDGFSNYQQSFNELHCTASPKSYERHSRPSRSHRTSSRSDQDFNWRSQDSSFSDTPHYSSHTGSYGGSASHTSGMDGSSHEERHSWRFHHASREYGGEWSAREQGYERSHFNPQCGSRHQHGYGRGYTPEFYQSTEGRGASSSDSLKNYDRRGQRKKIHKTRNKVWRPQK